MKFPDILQLALRNLREAKLRVGLTTMGVVVGVAVIVTMVSFGLGLQRNTVERFKDLDLFNEITVYGRSLSGMLMAEFEKRGSAGEEKGEGAAEREGGAHAEGESGDGRGEGEGSAERREQAGRRGGRDDALSSARTLDDEALEEIGRIPGVAYVEPNLSFTAYVRANGRALRQAVGGARVPNPASRFRNFDAGSMIRSPDADEAVVDSAFLKAFGYKDAREAVGQTLELLAPPETKPSASASKDAGDDRAREEGRANTETRASEDKEAPLSFFGLPLDEPGDESGGASARKAEDELVARRFRIVGVLKDEIEGGNSGRNQRFRGLMPEANIYVPLAFANEWSGSNLDTLDRVAVELARRSGVLGAEEGNGYGSATVRVENPLLVKDVSKRLDELGFRSFSLFSQLDEIRKVFLIINAALGLLGSISLLVASFGIANTMIMSILERTREIGIMKAIGAEDREIKLIFFVEAAVIGLFGGVLGTLAGWGIDKLANRLAYQFILKPKGGAFIDFFSLPAYLWLGAILFAMLVSVAASLYPASRAARIDPVRALRHD
ncbi:MAG TPA: FtsX-like permease family protein [Pyrinomonadaceae bacterium]|jgi:ABC-type lipoprotein release transport system permease subunit